MKAWECGRERKKVFLVDVMASAKSWRGSVDEGGPLVTQSDCSLITGREIMPEKIGKLSLGHTKGAWTDREGREVAQSCPTLCDPMDCSLPGSSVHGILQARALEWVARDVHWKSE